MDKSGKIYVKALKNYHDGNIDKAMNLCDKCLQVSRTNTSAINLKGLLYYFKGDLDNSEKCWRLSYKINNDEISKMYLKDVKNDKEKLEFYIKAQECIEKVKISEAIDLLKSCAETHYNFINVCNYLALCYIKRGDYEQSIEYINEVLKIDKLNEMANKNYKMLEEFGVVKSKKKHKKVFIAIILLITISLSVFTSKLVINKIKYKNSNINQKTKKVTINTSKDISNNKEKDISKDKTEIIDKKTPNSNSNVNKEKNIKTKETKIEFPYEQFKNSIENKKIEEIYMYVEKYSSVQKNVNEKMLMSKAEEILRSEGVNYYYNKGYEYIKKLNYKESKKYLLQIYPYAKGSDLYEHIIYLLATSFEKLGDVENALKYYTQFENEFPKGSYIEEVLYRLTIINKHIDINVAKQYAKKIRTNYPDSEYNNTIIQNIINQ